MGQLTTAMIAALSGFRKETIDAMTADLGDGENVDAVSAAGACSLDRLVTELSVDGTKAYTLAAPTTTGQKKIIRCVAGTTTPIGTLTITSPDTVTGFVCPATFVFQVAGQEIELEATAGLKWRCVRKKRAGALAVTVGTTDLAGYSLSETYQLTVADTVASTTTKGLPAGAVVGERCSLVNTAVSGSPVGSVDGAYIGMNGTAYTHMGAIGVAASTTVTGDFASVEWTGAAWQVINFSGITWS